MTRISQRCLLVSGTVVSLYHFSSSPQATLPLLTGKHDAQQPDCPPPDRAPRMTTHRKALDGFAISIMVVLCVCWGFQQVAIKVTAQFMSPLMQLALRSILAAMLVGSLMACRREGFSLRDGTVLPGLMAGTLFAAEFLCISVGLTLTTASHMVVFLYTAPIFTVLGLHWLIAGERMGVVQWGGIVLAFAGIGMAFGDGFSNTSANANGLIGDALGILAGILWAATTILIRRSALSEAPATKTLLYQLAVSGALLLLLAAVPMLRAPVVINSMVLASLFFQAVVIAFISFLLWFWMLRHYLASRLSVFSFLTPLFGVGFGMLLLDDPVNLRKA